MGTRKAINIFDGMVHFKMAGSRRGAGTVTPIFMTNELSKVEKVALEIFCFLQQRQNLVHPDQIDDNARAAFTRAYRFLDISKEFTRHY